MKIFPASEKRKTDGRRAACFTLLEILIVVVVAGLILAITAPALLERSERVSVETALTGIRTAVNETARRARATGETLSLTLDDDSGQFRVGTGHASYEPVAAPVVPASPDSENRTAAFLAAKPSYALSGDIEWLTSDVVPDERGEIVCTFFPDGQASAPDLPFEMFGRRFTLVIDRVTSAPVILETVD